MKEVCIDARMALSSGIGTYLRNLLVRLQNGPFKLRVILNNTILEKWKEAKNFDLILTKAAVYSLEEQIKLPFLIPSCSLFWSPHFNVPLGPIRAKKRMVTIHDVYHLAYFHKMSLSKKIYAKGVIPRAARIADQIVTISHFSRDEIVKYTGVCKEKIEVIHLGVDRTVFCPQQDSQWVRQKYSLPEKFFLFVSNLTPHKNIRGLLRALSSLPEVRMVFVGKRMKMNDWQEILDQIPSLSGRVLFLEEVDQNDLPLLYQSAYATVHPSFYEGFGLTPLEAMSCGCPVVVSNVASLPEVCGECAIYVDPHDPEDIARGIQRIERDEALRESLKMQGIERSQLFDWNKTAEKHVEVMERVMGFV